jgi:glycosyltransferase involved in cell wall biosynthesis
LTSVIILPPREDFSPDSAGAISLVVRRFALAFPGTVVLGTPRPQTFPGIDYIPVHSTFQVLRAIHRLRPEVVEVHQQPRLAMLLSLFIPRVLLFLHNDPLRMRGLKSRFGRRLAAKRLHRVVCVSAYLANRFGPGAEILWNPLTLSELPPRPELREPVLLYAGRMTEDKAPDIFIAACAQALPQMPGWRARMIGGDRFGPASPETAYVTAIRAAAREAGVAFDGPLPHTAVLAAMATAAIVVVPSRWAEPFGLTALEAMASGAALITTGQGGLAEVAGNAAITVPVDNASALAAAMVALTDDAARAPLVSAGLARAALFDTGAISDRLGRLRRAD